MKVTLFKIAQKVNRIFGLFFVRTFAAGKFKKSSNLITLREKTIEAVLVVVAQWSEYTPVFRKGMASNPTAAFSHYPLGALENKSQWNTKVILQAM